MQVTYTGPNAVLLMHEGKVWEVNPGDSMELSGVPKLPHFSSAEAPKTAAPKAAVKGVS